MKSILASLFILACVLVCTHTSANVNNSGCDINATASQPVACQPPEQSHQPAPPAEPRNGFFGKGAPFEINDLPAGNLKTGLLALDPIAKQKAMNWLHTLTFGQHDATESLHVDKKGGIFFACNFHCAGCTSGTHDKSRHNAEVASSIPDKESSKRAPTEKDASEPEIQDAPLPVSSPPAYNSKPGATKHIYLDFNGAIVAGKDWTRTDGTTTWNSWDCYAWSSDADKTTFTDNEQAEIKQVWERVAEDYAPFDVNVTTDIFYDPDTYTGDKNKVGWILITPITDKLGAQCPHYGVGGIAYGNVFGAATYFSKNQPAWVANLASGPLGIAQSASHEMGHNMGLNHDGTTTSGYYGGHNSTATAPSWGPIMGIAYNSNLTQWSKGEYYLANQTQDDLAIIAGKLAYRTDDHGGTYAAATVLSNASINSNGIIEKNTDKDAFSFTTAAGVINFNVATYKSNSGTWGGNLDVILELYNSSNVLIASNNRAVDVNASISQNVAAGSYYIVVKPTGAGTPTVNPPSGYTVYGSLGQYTVTGNFIPTSSILATRPTSGETLSIGVNETITWASGMGGNVKIELYKGGSLDSTIINSTPNNGSYTWAVPTNQMIANDYQIKITSIETPAVSHTTPNNFGIGQPPIYFANMNTDPGWTFDHPSWAYGLPNGLGQDTHGFPDPITGYTGANVIGYNLNGDYELNVTTTRWAKTPAINCANHKNVKLSLYRWLGVEGGYDRAYIEVSNNNTTWTQVWQSSAVAGVDNDDGTWVYCEYDISAVADGKSTVYVRWGMKTDDQWHFCGWNLDDVKVVGDPVFPVTYLGNGSTGGTVPIDTTKYISGATVTVLGNGGSLVKSGNAFVGWNTATDGYGLAYAPASTFTISANTSLYAQWTSTYANWASSHSLTGLNATTTANPDGDSLTNLQEFAFGTNPNLSGGALAYVAGGALTNPGPPIALNLAVGAGVDYRAVFSRRKSYVATGLTYTVEFSADLAEWVSSTDTPTVLTGSGTSNPSEIEAVSVSYPLFVPVSGGGYKKPTFFRITVSMP